MIQQQPTQFADFGAYTDVCQRLHRQALAWFEDHEETAFFRCVVEGEFTETQTAIIAAMIGGKPEYVYVQAVDVHRTDAGMLTRGDYLRMLQRHRAVPLIGGLDAYREHHCALND